MGIINLWDECIVRGQVERFPLSPYTNHFSCAIYVKYVKLVKILNCAYKKHGCEGGGVTRRVHTLPHRCTFVHVIPTFL